MAFTPLKGSPTDEHQPETQARPDAEQERQRMLKANIESAANRVGITPEQLALAMQLVGTTECIDGPSWAKLHFQSLAPYIAGAGFHVYQAAEEQRMQAEAQAVEAAPQPEEVPAMAHPLNSLADAKQTFFTRLWSRGASAN